MAKYSALSFARYFLNKARFEPGTGMDASGLAVPAPAAAWVAFVALCITRNRESYAKG